MAAHAHLKLPLTGVDMDWETVGKASVVAFAVSSGALAQGTTERVTVEVQVTGPDRDSAYRQAPEK